VKKKADKKLDGILLTTSVADFDGTIDDGFDAIEIDLEEGRRPGEIDTMSELFNQMEQA